MKIAGYNEVFASLEWNSPTFRCSKESFYFRLEL